MIGAMAMGSLTAQARLEGLRGESVVWTGPALQGAFTLFNDDAQPTGWRYAIDREGTTFYSPSVPMLARSSSDYGFWGAMALSDGGGAGSATLFPYDNMPADLGSLLSSGRDFRDVRFVDLNNDGVQDIVSNVYGTGCTLIAISTRSGQYDIQTPLRSDGTCIGGHGETILVADFDADGHVDVLLPSYERFDYLRNLGGGRFREMADEMGISYPEYRPAVEGAAAVDIDLNGSVDIVIASEILLNDGHGRFTPVAAPFGPTRVFDEGMAVADLDGDGLFDVVKNDPSLGPRIFWGIGNQEFADAGWMFGGHSISLNAFGISIGNLTGGMLPDLVLAGGSPLPDSPGSPAGSGGKGPRLCMQTMPRSFSCLREFLPAIPDKGSDLVLIADADADGQADLVYRHGNLRLSKFAAPAGTKAFRFDLRDRANLRTMYGRVLIVRCEADGSLIGTGFVDGGNGYMAQGPYVVTFTSPWCDRVRLQSPTIAGMEDLGTFSPGTYVVAIR